MNITINSTHFPNILTLIQQLFLACTIPTFLCGMECEKSALEANETIEETRFIFMMSRRKNSPNPVTSSEIKGFTDQSLRDFAIKYFNDHLTTQWEKDKAKIIANAIRYTRHFNPCASPETLSEMIEEKRDSLEQFINQDELTDMQKEMLLLLHRWQIRRGNDQKKLEDEDPRKLLPDEVKEISKIKNEDLQQFGLHVIHEQQQFIRARQAPRTKKKKSPFLSRIKKFLVLYARISIASGSSHDTL